jgi:hypothetical protein
MKLEVLQALHIRRTAGDLHLKVGAVAEFPEEDAIWLMLKAPGAVRPVVRVGDLAPEEPCTVHEPPVKAGWMIVYKRSWRDTSLDGDVDRCEWNGHSWTVQLTNGTAIPLTWVRSVRKTDGAGKVLAAWDTQAHGYDGRRKP